jgi:hypothetical protein
MAAPADALREKFTSDAWGLSDADFNTKVVALETEAAGKTTNPEAQVAWVLYRGYDLEINAFRRKPQSQTLGPAGVSTDLKTVLASLETERYQHLQKYEALTAPSAQTSEPISQNIPARSGW